MIFPDDAQSPSASPLREALRRVHRAPEAEHVARLAEQAKLPAGMDKRARGRARALIEHVRAERRRVGGIDALMQEYDLSSTEGVTLMCLAEALLRIPDAETQSDLIADKLGSADWSAHLGESESFFVNASTFGLMMAGRTLSAKERSTLSLNGLVKRLGKPVIRDAVTRAMRILGRQFVMGRTIEEALERAAPAEAKGYRHSYDMLGEAARTMADADRYLHAYGRAIEAAGAARGDRGPVDAPGVSVKLSALHPRYEFEQRGRVLTELSDRLVSLAELAAHHEVGLCVDAEEADRLDLSLDLIETVAQLPQLKDWDGFGLAVQAYQKRALALIDWLSDLGERSGRRLMTRLVKGAYWDYEIKRAQEGGFDGYPVFTRKTHTDVSYLACARRMLEAPRAVYPCFATHNANTLAAVIEMIGDRRDLEFQRLHGMGEALYARIVEDEPLGVACRVYAPVGSHEELLAYLVRRLLENGANTSFVNRIADDDLPIEEMLRDPVEAAAAQGFTPHPNIPAPADIFRPARANSAGIDLADPAVLDALKPRMDTADHDDWRAALLIAGRSPERDARAAFNPSDRTRKVGDVAEATAEDARTALATAAAAAERWDRTPAAERAEVLRKAGDLMEARGAALMTLIVREAGRSIRDAHLEVREAVDFLRYYANEAERLFAAPQRLPGPTGEENTLGLVGRGPFLCIAPWNFPLAIFTGQVAAALAAGCPALAKPAEQTPLVGAEAVRILHEAGIPADVLHFLPGDGPTIGGAVMTDDRLAGIAFTGSMETARAITKALAEREGPIIPFIAETGGVNAMIVDSTALAEQVTRDVLASAFQSAGQRCSALRLLCVQEDVADRQLEMIAGAMAELRVGDPALLSTDVGPVIDEEALEKLAAHREAMRRRFHTIAETPLHDVPEAGLFLAPIAFELSSVEDLNEEIFGPILHVARWRADALDQLVEAINAKGYGLTMSVHSRSETRIARVLARAKVGNIYVNRNQIGAVVGSQPFGGEALSGTGPKAGGPNYVIRFAVERAVCRDTTASGGNASLMTMGE